MKQNLIIPIRIKSLALILAILLCNPTFVLCQNKDLVSLNDTQQNKLKHYKPINKESCIDGIVADEKFKNICREIQIKGQIENNLVLSVADLKKWM